jgi:ATP-dependent DNA helicase RecG
LCAVVTVCRYIEAGRFKSPTSIIDDKEFHGTLFQQLDSTMAWFRDRLQKMLLIGTNKLPGLPQGKLAERQDVWEYPLNALREALANAICHRDYTSEAATMVRLYDDDHLTISNPGHLFCKLNVDDLLREHDSYPPNKLIAESFFNVGQIERWGSGTLLIADALKAQGTLPTDHQFGVTPA